MRYILLALFTPSLAFAAECGPSLDVYRALSERYDERRVSIGLAADAASIVETWASEAGTWTVIVTMPNGTSCLIGSGLAFQQFAGGEPA